MGRLVVAEGCVRERVIKRDRQGGREREREEENNTCHSVKNLTKLAHRVVEIEEAIGSSWWKDLSNLLVEDFFFPKKTYIASKS